MTDASIPEIPDNSSKTSLDYEALYFDLLMAVGNKHQGETRHQTAKRYIEQAEQGSGEVSQA